MRERTTGLLMVWLLLMAISSDQPRPQGVTTTGPTRISGKVFRGQGFETTLGQDLSFGLRYYAGDGEGWEAWVGDPAQPEDDFSAVVTPPYRGMNSRYIEGWHFRNSDNSGPNDGSVNAPQEIRMFLFVLNHDDYETAKETLGCILWACDDLEHEQAIELHQGVVRATGTLTITKMELGNLIVGERAWIEWFEFEAEFAFPDDGGGASGS